MSRVHKVQGNAKCEVCGNSRGQCFEVLLGEERHIFDSFACALDVLTPQCAHCGTPFVGQGVRVENRVYCSSECVNAERAERRDIRVDLNELYKNSLFQDAPALT